MRDLTFLMNLLAAYQLKARRLERIADYTGNNYRVIEQSEEAFYAIKPLKVRIRYLASFIRSLTT